MSKLIKYLIVDVKTGKWNWNKEIEHHSIAVPKMLNNLELRREFLLNKVANIISKGMKDSLHNRSIYNINKEITEIKEENNHHVYMLNEFKRKVMANLETETKISPIMNLKKMESPLSKKKTISISHMYERFDNDEIISRLNKFSDDLDETLEILNKTVEIWNSILKLYNETNSFKLLEEIKKINSILNNLNDDVIYEAFFSFDDATRGLISKGVTIKVYLNNAYNKLFDLIIRTFIKGVNNYRKSEESKTVDKAFIRMKELKIEDIDLKLLLDVKVMLDVEPLPKLSYEMCYKKIGEMHGNMNQKLFEISGLKYLKSYFSEKTISLVDSTIEQLNEIHKKISNKKEVCNILDDRKLIERNISELEIYHKIIKELLIDEPKDYFYLSDKLHTINSYISSKYYVLNKEDLNKCLKIIEDESFRQFISSCESLMFALRKELKHKEDVVEADDLVKVGIATGKTTMINSYIKAVEVILATLGTFMGNTLHCLIREILQNLPEDYDRKELIYTYERTEIALREFDQDSLSDSL